VLNNRLVSRRNGTFEKVIRAHFDGLISKCATISKLTRAQLISDAQDEYMKVMNRPMSPKQEAKAKKLATEFENIRIKRMRLSDE